MRFNPEIMSGSLDDDGTETACFFDTLSDWDNAVEILSP